MNAFEQFICEETRPPHDNGHRVFIRRYAAATSAPMDLRPLFRLTNRWEAAEDAKSLELDEAYYAFPPRTRHERMVFSFSQAKATPEGGTFKVFVDRGFLWGRLFRCRFEGDFANPSFIVRELLSGS